MILLSQLILNKNPTFSLTLPSLLQQKNFLEKKNQNYPPTIPGDFYLFRRHCRFNFLIIRKKTEDKRKIECEKKHPGSFQKRYYKKFPEKS